MIPGIIVYFLDKCWRCPRTGIHNSSAPCRGCAGFINNCWRLAELINAR